MGDSASLFFPITGPGRSVEVHVEQSVQPLLSNPGACHFRTHRWEVGGINPPVAASAAESSARAHLTRHQLGAGPDPGALIGQTWGGAETLLGAVTSHQKHQAQHWGGPNADWSIPRPWFGSSECGGRLLNPEDGLRLAPG